MHGYENSNGFTEKLTFSTIYHPGVVLAKRRIRLERKKIKISIQRELYKISFKVNSIISAADAWII